MLTLRLPDDDRRQGLAERQESFVACNEGQSSPAFAAGSFRLDLAALDLTAMSEQLEIACRYGAMIERVAIRHGLLPSVIAGFCSRRSGFGLELTPTGVTGTRDFRARPALTETRDTSLPLDDLGFARGLMGLDYDHHELACERGWRDPEANVTSAFGIIATHRAQLRRCTTLQGTGLLRASLTAFECGIERVQRAVRRGQDVDSPTEGWSQGGLGCGADVVARAHFFQGEGWD